MNPLPSDNRFHPPRWLIPTLWIVLAIVWFGTLGYRDLIHADEGRYAEIAREMAASGDWITPRLNDLKYFEKPALQYWATAFAFKLFGESEFVARIWPGLCGFLTIALTAFTARRLWGERAGWFSGLVAASLVWMVGNGHFLSLDMGVTAWLTLVLCAFALAQHDDASEKEARYWMWAAWAGMACATLSKGLIGLLIPGAVLVLYTLWQRDLQIWAKMQWVAGLAIFAALTVPWFVVVSQRNPEFAHFFFIHEHFERFLTPGHRRTGAWYYFFPFLALGMVPWTTLLPVVLVKGIKPEVGRFQPQRLLWLWVVFVFAFFSKSDSKLSSYILPMFPALALLIGHYLANAGSNALRVHALLQTVTWAALGIATLWFVDVSHRSAIEQSYIQLAAIGALAMAAVLAVASWLALRGRMLGAAFVMAAASLSVGQYIMQSHQLYAPLKSTRQLVEQIQPQIDITAPFFSVDHYEQPLPFYLKRPVTLVNYLDEFQLGIEQEPAKAISTMKTFMARWNSLPKATAITSPDRFKKLEQAKLPMRVIHRDEERVVFVKP
jgi:4-amino-4-deoxy-L-arabinose transferase-like glycosyltransferase